MGYGEHKRNAGNRQKKQSEDGREIGIRLTEKGQLRLPKVGNAKRKASCKNSLKKFAQTYFPLLFYLAWSPAHDRVCKRIETAVLDGGLFAVAMPRGSGKTTISLVACVWAALYGHRKFIVLVGSDKEAAVDLLDAIKVHLESQERLGEDFPEVCYPIRKLDGIPNRCKGQLLNGQRTRIKFTEQSVCLPTIEGAPSSGSVIRVRGLLGRIRGMQHTRPEGDSIRPDLVLLDDPQTDESADSHIETKKRMRVVNKAILGLAGPDKDIAGICPCTVIQPDDLADQLLDDDKSPDWIAEKISMLSRMPVNLDLWQEYDEHRRDGLRARDKGEAKNAFYRKHRKALDKGAKHYWPERVKPGVLSAIQFAMDWYLRDPEGFAAECQNEPVDPDRSDDDLLTADEIIEKQHHLPKDEIPLDATLLTAFVDVQDRLLFYCVIAWNPATYTGYIARYGSWPEQRTTNFTYLKARHTLQTHYGNGRRIGTEAAIRKGLADLFDFFDEAEFTAEDGTSRKVSRVLVDGGHKTTEIKKAVRKRADPKILVAFGRTPAIGSKAIHEGSHQDGDEIGDNWRVRTDPQALVRFVAYNTNVWKTFTHKRLSTDIDQPGSLSLFRERPDRHDTLARHLLSEGRARKEVDGIELDLWKLPPNKPDNHWFDCVVGCTVAGSIERVHLADESPPKKKKRKRKRRGSGISTINA